MPTTIADEEAEILGELEALGYVVNRTLLVPPRDGRYEQTALESKLIEILERDYNWKVEK